MIIIRHDNPDALKGRKVSIALGVFDGVHAGHRKLLETLLECAGRTGSASVVYTFENHPEAVLFGNAPKYIDTFEEKAAKIASLGIDYLWAVPFTRELAALKPETFIRQLTSPYTVACIIAGYDYSFGEQGRGRAEDLRRFGAQYGFSTAIVPAVHYGGLPVSSSRIREMIAAGEMEKANELLCSPYKMGGQVDSGRHIGTQLGFPTANIGYDAGKVLPPRGVYITRTGVDGEWLASITNIGCNPTIGRADTITIETHILDFERDIYGRHVEVEFLRYLRPEMKFPDKTSLAAQIQKDLDTAKLYFSA